MNRKKKGGAAIFTDDPDLGHESAFVFDARHADVRMKVHVFAGHRSISTGRVVDLRVGFAQLDNPCAALIAVRAGIGHPIRDANAAVRAKPTALTPSCAHRQGVRVARYCGNLRLGLWSVEPNWFRKSSRK